MSRKKQVALTPEANASQLLTELREENRRAREILADNKALFRQMKEEREKAEELVKNIQVEMQDFVEAIMKREVAHGSEMINVAVENARDQIVARLREMTSAVLGLPSELFQPGSIKFSNLSEELRISTLKL